MKSRVDKVEVQMVDALHRSLRTSVPSLAAMGCLPLAGLPLYLSNKTPWLRQVTGNLDFMQRAADAHAVIDRHAAKEAICDIAVDSCQLHVSY
jgi:hypothetical protein